MEADTLTLSRIQFAMTAGFHFLFPPITIGLAWLLVIIEGLAWKRNDPVYERAGRFFGSIFALTFAVGVATGIVMEFQFGTNWAEYSKFVGDIFGAPLAAEALFAFFLESAFLGVYLFGRERVSRRVHWFSILMVAVGSLMSAFWILVANSWQQTPAGYVIQNGRAELVSFWQAVFNVSTFFRFPHTIAACLTVGAFFMAGISAYLILRDKDRESAQKTLKVSLIFGLVASLVTLMPTGDLHARQVAFTQPEKFAAMEGLVRGGTMAPLTIFGKPDNDPPKLEFAFEIPGLLSLMTFGDWNAYINGIEELEESGHPTPSIVPTFISFHTMVGLGMLFIGLTSLGVFLLRRKKLYGAKWYLRAMLYATPLPLAACQFGWILAEVGRQPWVVYRVLKTADAFSPNVGADEVLFSIIMFACIYLMLGGLYLFILVKKSESARIRRPQGRHDAMDLNTIWFLLIGILLAGYAILDGFDLGVGVLHLFARSERERRTYLNAIGPVWDGNEVWLLTAGGAMFAAFPPVYATVFSGMYVAFMLVLLVLIVRAVSLEFRHQVDHPSWRAVWDWAFGLSSLGASLLFGVAIGNVLHGLPIAADGELEIPFLALLSPYALLIGVLTLTLFVMHGSLYMALKSDGDIRRRMVRWISRSWRATVLLYFVATVTTFIVSRHLFDGFLKNPLFWIALPLLVAAIGYTAFATHTRNHGRAFVSSALTMALMIGMMGLSLYPQMVPSSMDPTYSLTIYNASSTPRTLMAMLVIAAIGVPAVLVYTAWIYRTFAGKVVLTDDGY